MDVLKVLLIILLFSSQAFADWYILIPKKLPEKREKPKSAPLPQTKFNKIGAKPYKIEVKKILSPDFAVRTLELEKVTRKDLEGKRVIVVFLKDLYSPLSELLLSTLQELVETEKNLVILAVDVNDADFPLLRKFKKSMKLKDILLTADSYVYLEFRKRLKDLGVPSLVVIDRYGFIRFFANEIGKEKIANINKELEKILKSLG